MEDWEEAQSPVMSNITLGNAGNLNSGGQQNGFRCINDNKESSWHSDNGDFGHNGGNKGLGPREGVGGGFRSFSSGNDENENKLGGSSWNGGGDRFRGGRGRGERGGFKNSFNSDVDENSNYRGFNSDFGGRGVRGGRRGRGGRGAFQQGGDVEGKRGFGGGYRGRDEEVFSKGSQNVEEKEDGGTAGPKVSYVPAPPPEDEGSVFAHYATGINFNKYDDILVDVSGSNPPKAILTFEEAQLCETLSRNVVKSGYEKPTPVQKHGIPIISAGRDLMACAQTGSGKTAAFLLPILQCLMREGVAASKFSEVQEPEVVIVAPTRELINQIYLEARKFAYGTCVRPVVVYGGTNTGYTIREVLKGCNILCGTPGRLLDIIGRGKVGLSKVRYLVMDEADRMLDMGFESEMRKLVSSPGMPPKGDRQTLMFSATYPEDIQRLAADFLKVDYLFLAVGVVGGACSDIEQQIIQVTRFSKREKLLELLKATGTERTMVFVETKRSADFIAAFLCQEEVPTTSIHGDREQREREKALSDFRTGRCPVLVATSVAARGLDIEHVQHVVNFDLPKDVDEYVHRIGRTGRCGNVGKAMSFFDAESDTPLARSLVKVLSGAQQEVPSWLEEIAFSAHGTTGFNPRGKVFASTDTRRDGSFQMNQTQLSAAQRTAAEAEEEWE